MNLIRVIKSIWLEVVLAIAILGVIVLSITDSIKDISIDYGKTLKQSEIQIEITGLTEYIEQLKELEDCTIFISSKDNSGYYLTSDMVDALKELGFNEVDILLDKEKHSFIGIYSDGNMIYQHIGGDEDITFGQMMDGRYVYMKSTTFEASDEGCICIDHKDYAPCKSGFNIVTIDNKKSELIDSVVYGINFENIPVYRLINGECEFMKDTGEI